MGQIILYVIRDLVRSRWTLAYTLFYLLVGFGVLLMGRDPARAMVTFLQIVLILTPLMGTLFGIMYYYATRDFQELLLAQPLPRTHVLLGQWVGIALSLGVSLLVGLGTPFVVSGFGVGYSLVAATLLGVGMLLGAIFAGLALSMGLLTDHRIQGFGMALILWLFLAVVYDGLVLALLMILRDYPVEKLALVLTFLNPIDLARILLIMQMDVSALLGYTGAVFREFLGASRGMVASAGALVLWLAIPAILIVWRVRRRDF